MSETTGASLPDRIDPNGLADLRDQGAAHRLIDVRTPAEFQSAHIEGAINVPLDVLSENPERVAAELDGPAVLICRSGARAGQAQQKLAATGHGDVSVLEGGVIAWEQTGRDVVRGRQRWDLERQVRFAAGLLVVLGFVTGFFWPPAIYLSGAVGFGLVVAALTNTCAMGMLLAQMPWNGSAEQCDVDSILGRLR